MISYRSLYRVKILFLWVGLMNQDLKQLYNIVADNISTLVTIILGERLVKLSYGCNIIDEVVTVDMYKLLPSN